MVILPPSLLVFPSKRGAPPDLRSSLSLSLDFFHHRHSQGPRGCRQTERAQHTGAAGTAVATPGPHGDLNYLEAGRLAGDEQVGARQQS